MFLLKKIRWGEIYLVLLFLCSTKVLAKHLPRVWKSHKVHHIQRL